MEGRVATVLVLMLSLAAAAAAARVDTIRLPSRAHELMAKAGAKERPWKCCNRSLCTMSFPPLCWCHDVVERCSGACKDCQEAEREQESDPEGYVCHDMYQGNPGPECSGGGGTTDDKANVAVASAADEAMITAAAEEDNRPWKCCDDTLCDRSAPPKCRCLDTVDQCAGACKRCEVAESDPSRRVCKDRYKGWPGPRCTSN